VRHRVHQSARWILQLHPVRGKVTASIVHSGRSSATQRWRPTQSCAVDLRDAGRSSWQRVRRGRVLFRPVLGPAPLPMLARLQSTLPRGEQWRYEPKFDGFRGLLWRRGDADVQLLSRNVKDLSSWFPEIVHAAQVLSTGTLLDGEIVIADSMGRSDFGALQHRMSVAKRASAAAALERPAVLLVFDLLRLGDTDLTVSPFCKRRDALEQLVAGRHPCLQLVEQTADFAEAEDWLNFLPIEGVVAKRADGCYLPGRRNEWIKVKRQRTADCVVIGIANGVRGPALVLGLRHADGELHHLGSLGGVICHLQRNRHAEPVTRRAVAGPPT
jgi:ATP-dependent DNA ligase